MSAIAADFSSVSTSELVDAVEAAVLELAGREVPESGLVCMEVAERLGRVLDVGESALSGLVGRVCSTGVHKAWAFSSTSAWLVSALGMARGRANQRVALARQLPRIPVVAKMLASQELSLGFASLIADSVQRLDEGEDLEVGVQILLELHEAGCSVNKAAQAGHRIKELIAERLGRPPEDARRDPERSWLQKSRSGLGGSFWKGWFNAEDSAAIEEIIDPIAKPKQANDPRDLAQRTADALCSAVTGGNRNAGITVVVDLAAWTVRHGTTYPFGDHLTDQWRHRTSQPADSGDDAHGEDPGTGLESLNARPGIGTGSADADASGDSAPTGGVGPGQDERWKVDPGAVQGRVAARLLNGSPVSASDVRRIAEFAGISVLLVGRDGLPLYLGRAERLGSQGQRRALEALYETCAVETCQTPGHLCEIHHLEGGWQAGVPTDIDKLVLACKWHNCWFNDHPDQILESRDSRGRTIITILPPPWASGRGFKNRRRPVAHTDLSAYDKSSTSTWFPTTGVTARSVPHVRDLSAHETIVTRGP
jgi:hypothetical protein